MLTMFSQPPLRVLAALLLCSALCTVAAVGTRTRETANDAGNAVLQQLASQEGSWLPAVKEHLEAVRLLLTNNSRASEELLWHPRQVSLPGVTHGEPELGVLEAEGLEQPQQLRRWLTMYQHLLDATHDLEAAPRRAEGAASSSNTHELRAEQAGRRMTGTVFPRQLSSDDSAPSGVLKDDEGIVYSYLESLSFMQVWLRFASCCTSLVMMGTCYVFLQIATSDLHSCGILVNGSMVCWGRNSEGQCDVPSTGLSWIALPRYLDADRSCGITVDGAVHCWGDEGSIVRELQQFAEQGGHVWRTVSMSWGYMDVCAVDVEGVGFCGLGKIPASLLQLRWKRIEVLDNCFCGLTLEGEGYCWDEGRITALPLHADGSWTDISGSYDNTVCLSRDSQVLCWTMRNPSLTLIPRAELTEGKEWRVFNAPCGITVDDELVCRGTNEPTTPTTASFQRQKWFAVATGSDRRCAISLKGEVFCWGEDMSKLNDYQRNASVALITGFEASVCTMAPESPQVQCWGPSAALYTQRGTAAVGIEAPVALDAGLEHVCILGADGSLFCDGLCGQGECDIPGNGRLKWKSISAGFQATCGVTMEGRLCCWGKSIHPDVQCDDEGQNELEDVAWTLVATGNELECGATGNVVQCWIEGQLRTTLESNTGWRFLDAAKRKLCGITGDRRLLCNVPVGLTAYPAGVNGNPGWESVSIGRHLDCGLLVNGTALCSDWFAPPGTVRVFQPHKQWRSIVAAAVGICGITATNVTECWAPSVELPAEKAPFLDVRFAHMAGLLASDSEVCGYQFLRRRHVCFGFSSGHFTVSDSELLHPVGTLRFAFQPSRDNMVPVDSSLIALSPDDPGARTWRSYFPFSGKFVVSGRTRITWVVVNAGYTGYGSINTENIRWADLFSVQQIPVSQPLIQAAAGDRGVCVLMANLTVWCDGPLAAGSSSLSPLIHIAAADDHACGIENGTLALICWGTGPLPNLSAPHMASAMSFRHVTTDNNATCAISTGFEVFCWGTGAAVHLATQTFTGKGWLEVLVKSTIICASHVNGRLVCVDYADARKFGQLSPFPSLAEVVVGLAPSTASDQTLCPSVQSCLTSDPSSAPYHDSLVLIENVRLRSPLAAPLRFLGSRTLRLHSSEVASIDCSLDNAVGAGAACLHISPSPDGFRLTNVAVSGTRKQLLHVEGRPFVLLSSTTWEAAAPSSLCEAKPSMVALKKVAAVEIEYSDWRSLPHSRRYGEQWEDCGNGLVGKAHPATGGLVIEDAVDVAIQASTWRGLTFLNGSALAITAVDSQLNSVVLDACLFEENKLWQGSGGMKVVNSNSLGMIQSLHYLIENTGFYRNQGSEGGGLSWVHQGSWPESSRACFLCLEGNLPTLVLSNVSFVGNAASRFGGAASADGLSLHFLDSELSDNTAAGAGGAVASVNGSFQCDDCHLARNSVHSGVATGVVQERQPGFSFSGGGALAIMKFNLPGFVLRNSSFSNNTAEGDGGALAVRQCLVQMENTQLIGNHAADTGGSVHFSDIASDSVMAAVEVSGNSAHLSGGGVFVDHSSLSITSMVCENNYVTVNTMDGGRIPSPYDVKGVGGCLTIAGGSTVDVRHAVIERNSAVQGAGLHVHCGVTVNIEDLAFLNNTASAAGSSLFFECPSDWLSQDVLQQAQVVLASRGLQLGSGPVFLQTLEVIPALFEGYAEEEHATLRFALLDVNGDVVVTDSAAECIVTPSVLGDDSEQPGLLVSSRFQPTWGIVEVMPFGVTASDPDEFELNVTCKDTLELTVIIPVAKVVPVWHVHPQDQWVPSSGPSILPMHPTPEVSLQMEHSFLLHSVTVVCTVKARSMADGGVVPLLNPPADGYFNTEGNGTLVPLPGLAIDAPYGSTVRLTVDCVRDNERLKAINHTVTLVPPGVQWLHLPGPGVVSGKPFLMSATFVPAAYPAANASSCTASLVGSITAYVLSSAVPVQQGIAEWPEIILVAPLDSLQTLRVNCSTGYHALPQVLSATVRISQCRPGEEPGADFTTCTSCTGNAYSPGGLEPCRGCPVGGARCEGGQLELLDGYFPSSSAYLWHQAHGDEGTRAPPMSSTTVLYPCDVVEACGVTNANTTAGYYCKGGYDGPLCGTCKDSYTKAGLYCVECWPPWLAAVVIGFGIVLALLVLGYIALFRKTTKPSVAQILFRITLSYIQILSSLGQFRAKATEMVQQALGLADAVGNSVFSTGPLHCTFRFDYYSRFILSMSLPSLVGALVVVIATSGLIVSAVRSKWQRHAIATHGLHTHGRAKVQTWAARARSSGDSTKPPGFSATVL